MIIRRIDGGDWLGRRRRHQRDSAVPPPGKPQRHERRAPERVRLPTNTLAAANSDLQNEIVRREAAEQALRRSRNELAALSHQLITAQEAERTRIARELHDSVGQQLGAIKFSLERVECRSSILKRHRQFCSAVSRPCRMPCRICANRHGSATRRAR